MAQTEIKNLENSEVEIIGEMATKDFEKHRSGAIGRLGVQVEIPGFRKGHVPESILVKKLGEETVLEEMAQSALREEYPRIIAKHDIAAIGAPDVTITKIAKDNPLGFKIRVAVMPKIELPDYGKIAKGVLSKKEGVVVTEKEVEDTILEIRRMRAKTAQVLKDEEKSESKEEGKDNLPDLNDEFVKALGGNFKNLADFKEKLKGNIKKEKELKARDKKRMEVLEEIIKKSNIALPSILVESELDRMMAQFKDNIARAGGVFEEYLKHAKKTEQDLRGQWRTDAEKKAKTQLVLNAIAVKESISAPKEALEKEVSLLLKHYKDADPERARIYVETMLVNEHVFKFLEEQA